MIDFFTKNMWVLVLILLWSTPWKGFALWKSARKGQLGWFIALLIINTLAILDILYIFFFSEIGKKQEEENFEDDDDFFQKDVRNFGTRKTII